MPPSKKSAAANRNPAPPAPAPLLHEEISVRAYALFLQRGAVDGWDLDDWLRAERDLLAAAEPKKKPVRRKKAEPIEASVK